MQNRKIHPLVTAAMAQAFGGMPFLKELFDRANRPVKIALEESKAHEVIGLAKNPKTKPSIRTVFGGVLKWTQPTRDKIGKEPGEARVYFFVVRPGEK